MKKLLLITMLLVAAGSGVGYHFYLDLRQQAGLDSPWAKVTGTPPDARQINLPAWPYNKPWNPFEVTETYHFPIRFGDVGPARPLLPGAQQYPFLCQSEESGLGQPVVDNQTGWGVPVYATTTDGQRSDYIIGYSKDCGLPTRVHYLYYTNNSGKYPKRIADHVDKAPASHQLLVRAEVGTINRYIYALLLPTTLFDHQDEPDTTLWNRKLVYYFKGGISIGFQQGKLRLDRLVKEVRPLLEQGYAVAFSTANETDNTYNIAIQADTAARVKRQFEAHYGKPMFTMGFGGSGGGLQQYLLAQNAPGIIDGGVALIAYPDMVTQTTYALDCELLEYYFDHGSSDPEFWRNPSARQAVLGLSVAPSADQGKSPRLGWLENVAQLLRREIPRKQSPGSECNAGWRGSTPLINNPKFHMQWDRFERSVRQHSHWTHWQDNQQVYGTDQRGMAHSPWSNLGVQYGLQALQQQQISIEQFLELNSRIGSWKAPADMDDARLWHVGGDPRLYRLTPYGEHNMTHEGRLRNGAIEMVAPRFHGSFEAARAAWRSGNVFRGKLDIPIMDVRMYLDHEQNIHHSWAALSTRKRLLEAGSDVRLSPIWMTTKPFNPMWDAVSVMDEWLTRASDLRLPAAEAVPASADDRCFTANGELIASGKGVWNGRWNKQPQGLCSQQFPFYQSSRQVAGEDVSGDTIQCSLQPVSKAIQRGIYQPIDMRPWQQQLERIFPQGVCDYSVNPSADDGQVSSALEY